ncbi:MAG: aldo/keto reductase [Thermosynechococcaceae cyanobacterium]
MQTRQLGTTSIQVTPILMGTWQAGKSRWVGIEDADSIAAIRAAVESGVTTIDTAEIYGQGHSEEIVAEAVSDMRDRLVYVTKVFPTHLQYDQVIEACEASLQRLKTDTIDLYFIHWPAGAFDSKVVPIEETMSAMVKLKEQGKIRAIGVSNFSQSQLAEAAQYGRIDSLQIPYSLFWRYVEQEAQAYCIKEQITIFAYSPLAQGLLTGKFGPQHQFDPADNRASNKLFQGENYDRAQTALSQLRPIAEQKGISLSQLALAWVMAQPRIVAIAGARNAAQAKDNAQAVQVTLSESERAEIDAIGRGVTDCLDSNPLMWNF